MVKRKHTPVYFPVLQQFIIKRCMDVWLFHIFQRKIWQFTFFVTFSDKSAEITHIINVLIIHLKNIAMKVSLFKQKNKQRTIAHTELQDVVKSVRDCVYSSASCARSTCSAATWTTEVLKPISSWTRKCQGRASPPT